MNLDRTMPVLVVDDYKTVVRIICHLLARAGFSDVDQATDAEEALSMMRARRYGLVMSDWHMAPVSGLDLLRQAKADDRLRDTPFIIVSADVAPENVAAAKRAGASAYVAKPFGVPTLIAHIENLLPPREVHSGRSDLSEQPAKPPGVTHK